MRGSTLALKKWKKTPISVIGVISVFAVLLLLLWFNTTNSLQSVPAIYPKVYFAGEYRIGNSDWKAIEEGKHIPSTQGDVALKGQFHMVSPDGEYIGLAEPGTSLAFYINHINITVQEQGQENFKFDIEGNYVGNDLCGECILGYEILTSGPITLTFHNNHQFGNEKAIDDFLQELSVYAGLSFEKDFMAQGNVERNVGLALVIIAFCVLGTALFSVLLQIEGSGKLWLIGLSILFAGGYFVYGSKGVFFWSDSIIGNTTILGACMMLYMLCISALIVTVLDQKFQKNGNVAVACLGAVCVFIPVFCLVSECRFYDTWMWWAMAQTAVNVFLLICLVWDLLGAKLSKIFYNIGFGILLIGFEADIVGIACGWWQGGIISKYIFAALFCVALVLVWQIIPKNINATRKAREMEAEQKAIRAQLQENRIAIMISQIQPHFIYNTLGTIQYLCKKDPEQAAQLVQSFSLYLRGNFSELDNTVPIRFAQELEHVRCYTGIELVRFPDMSVHYDIQTEEFLLPALTVQPLVENAIKHGLMGLEEGGNVTICAYETPTHYCVKVTDDGVGFDTTQLLDEKKHIGIRNVRERLQAMCGGSLCVESWPGKGTEALIQIPKEGKEA